ncbi:MAG TPA: hypothetical protein VF637_17290 [Sphingomicrobium sp.]|jgi:hypothetical protein
MPYPLSHGVGKGWPAASALPAGVIASAFTAAQLPDANRVYQRSTTTGGGQGKGQGFVTHPMTVTATTPIYARCRSAADGSTIVQAPYLALASASAGSLPVMIPGIDARLGWFYVDLAPSASGPWQLGTTPIGMGALTMMGSNQSLGLRMIKRRSGANITALGLTPPANGRVYATWGGESDDMLSPVWTMPDTGALYDSAGAVQYLNRMIAELGVNCGLCGHPVGGAASSAFRPSLAAAPNTKTRMVDIINAIGGFETYMVFIGHTDSTTNITGVNTRSNLSGAMDLCTARNHRGNNFRAIVASIPSNTDPALWGSQARKEFVRKVTYDWTINDCAPRVQGGAAYAQNGTAFLYDGVHQDNAGAVVWADAFFDAWRNGSQSGDAALTGAVPAAVSTFGPTTPTYLPGKRYAQALEHDSFQIAAGGSAGGGVVSIGMRVFLTTLPTANNQVAFADGSFFIYVKTDGGLSVGFNPTTTIKMPLNKWFDLIWTKISEDPFQVHPSQSHQLWIDGVKASEITDANLAMAFYLEGAPSFRQRDSAVTGTTIWNSGVKTEAHGLWHRHLNGVIPDVALTGQEAGINAFVTGNGALVGSSR